MVQHVPPNSFHAERPERIVVLEGILKGHTATESLSFLSLDYEAGQARLKHIPVNAGSTWANCSTVLVQHGISRDRMIQEYGKTEVAAWERLLAKELTPAKESGDNYWCSKTLEVAAVAAQAAIEAARDILRGYTENAFCLIRPPGHHCFNTPQGFCVLNNVVLAAREFLTKGKRVAILDWDYHFGDGTAKAFLRDPNVMFASLHSKQSLIMGGNATYPPNDSRNLKGDGLAQATRGRMFNIQWTTDDADDNALIYAMSTVIIPAFQTFNPAVILISAGYDALAGDDLAGMKLTPSVFKTAARYLAILGIPLLFVLEGGYNPELLASGVQETIEGVLQGAEEPLETFPQYHHRAVVDDVDYLRQNCIAE